jgi:hypothetical protein
VGGEKRGTVMFGIVKQLKRIADELHDQNLHADRLEIMYKRGNDLHAKDSALNRVFILNRLSDGKPPEPGQQ